MKNLLSILIATFFLSNIVTYAQKKNNPFTEIALIQAKRKNPTSKGDTPISRSIIQTANAFHLPLLLLILMRMINLSVSLYSVILL